MFRVAYNPIHVRLIGSCSFSLNPAPLNQFANQRCPLFSGKRVQTYKCQEFKKCSIYCDVRYCGVSVMEFMSVYCVYNFHPKKYLDFLLKIGSIRTTVKSRNNYDPNQTQNEKLYANSFLPDLRLWTCCCKFGYSYRIRNLIEVYCNTSKVGNNCHLGSYSKTCSVLFVDL